ncbi:MAG: hypothetical protein SVX43_14285, partial [Cyanobacteriota bacterium]|nr:hypothetical protein [Cyanobacteriota bacterium]
MFKNSLCYLSVVGFVSCWGMGSRFSSALPALAAPPPVLAQTQPTPAIAPLLGEWRFTEEGESIGLIFSTDSRVFFILPDSEGSAIAVQMKYETNSQTQPQQLDIIASPEEKVLTIFELTPEGQLRLDLEVQPGDPRPERLGENALLFERVSDATAPPETMQVIDLTAAPPPSTAVQLIAILLRAQQVYYLEQGQFAADVEELGLVPMPPKSNRSWAGPVSLTCSSVAIARVSNASFAASRNALTTSSSNSSIS